MRELCEEIYTKQPIWHKLGFGQIQIDTDKIVAAGHSFGGMTAVRSIQCVGRFQACLVLDPWLFVKEADINAGKADMTRPILSLTTEHFQKMCEFDQWTCLKNLFNKSKNPKKENIVINTAFHEDQTDFAILAPLEISFGLMRLPRTDRPQIYFLCTQLMLSFLGRIGFNNTFDLQEVERRIKTLEKKYVRYDLKYEPPQSTN